MKVIDLEYKVHDFEHEDVRWSVHSHKSFQAHNATFIVKLLGPGCEIAVEALTRGEGMVMLADVMKSLGYRLAREALEQEGAFHGLTGKAHTDTSDE